MSKRTILIPLFVAAISIQASAQESTFHKAFMSSFDAATDKIVQLAEAFSVDQYNWRPDAGVRSVNEALMHVASANFFFGGSLGAEVPSDMQGRNLEEEITSKEEAIEVLKQSIDFAREAIEGVSESELSEEIDWFDGSKVPKMRMVFLMSDHVNEHLGQLIAYARSQGVTPPWSS